MKLNNKIAFLGALLLCLGSFTQVVAAAEDYLGNSVETLGFFPNVVLGANNAKKAKKERRKMKKERKKAEAAASRAEAAAARAEESLSTDDGYVTADDGSNSEATLSPSDSGDDGESSSMRNAGEALEVATDDVVAAPVDSATEAAENDPNAGAAIEAGDVNVDGTEDPVLGEEAAGLKATLSAKLNGAKVFVTTNVAALWAAVKSPKTCIIDPALAYTKENPYRVVPVAGGVAIVTGAGVYFYVYPSEWKKFKSWAKEKAAYVFG